MGNYDFGDISTDEDVHTETNQTISSDTQSTSVQSGKKKAQLTMSKFLSPRKSPSPSKEIESTDYTSSTASKMFQKIDSKLDLILQNQNSEKYKLQKGKNATETESDQENFHFFSLLKESNNLSEAMETGAIYKLEQDDGAIIQCKVCADYLKQHKEHTHPKGRMSTGILYNQNKLEQLLAGKTQAWYSFKDFVLSHFGGKRDHQVHSAAIADFEGKQAATKRSQDVLETLVASALYVVKVKGAAEHFGELLHFLSSRKVDIGDINHSRYVFIVVEKITSFVYRSN